MLAAPPVKQAIHLDNFVDVALIQVTGPDSLGEKLVKIYVENPSPFVTGPTTLDQLCSRLDEGFRHFLILNGQGEAVGVTAFNTRNNMLCNSVTEFTCRGKGYQLNADIKLRELLVEEGCREFCNAVLRKNTRMRRALEAAGWDMQPDPNNPNLLLGRLFVDDKC